MEIMKIITKIRIERMSILSHVALSHVQPTGKLPHHIVNVVYIRIFPKEECLEVTPSIKVTFEIGIPMGFIHRDTVFKKPWKTFQYLELERTESDIITQIHFHVVLTKLISTKPYDFVKIFHKCFFVVI
jgi:hypothetical protein